MSNVLRNVVITPVFVNESIYEAEVYWISSTNANESKKLLLTVQLEIIKFYRYKLNFKSIHFFMSSISSIVASCPMSG